MLRNFYCSKTFLGSRRRTGSKVSGFNSRKVSLARQPKTVLGSSRKLVLLGITRIEEATWVKAPRYFTGRTPHTLRREVYRHQDRGSWERKWSATDGLALRVSGLQMYDFGRVFDPPISAGRVASVFAACRNLADAPSSQAVYDALVVTLSRCRHTADVGVGLILRCLQRPAGAFSTSDALGATRWTSAPNASPFPAAKSSPRKLCRSKRCAARLRVPLPSPPDVHSPATFRHKPEATRQERQTRTDASDAKGYTETTANRSWD